MVDSSESTSTKWLVGTAVVLLVLLFGAATNPNMNEHKREIGSYLEEETQIADFFGSEAAGAVAGIGLTYNDYTVFSTTTRDGKIVTLGAAGQVLVLGRENR